MVALDVTTGKYKWHYQYVPHDVWDLDAVSPAVLFETMVDGRRVKAVGHAGKTGWYYVHDRATGKLIRKSQAFVPQENMFAQPTATGVRMLPGATGGLLRATVPHSPQQAPGERLWAPPAHPKPNPPPPFPPRAGTLRGAPRGVI